MSAQAHVTSTEALAAFRARLVVFRATALQALDEVSMEVNHTRQWVRDDRRFFWEAEIRRRQKRLDQAQQELMAARLSSLQDDTLTQNAMRKARAALHEAEEKLRTIKNWERNYDLKIGPVFKQVGGLRTFLEHEMPEAIALLARMESALESYVESPAAPVSVSGSPAADGPESAPSAE